MCFSPEKGFFGTSGNMGNHAQYEVGDLMRS
jgi:hypothetical protein